MISFKFQLVSFTVKILTNHDILGTVADWLFMNLVLWLCNMYPNEIVVLLRVTLTGIALLVYSFFFKFRWDREKPATVSNLVLLKFKEVSWSFPIPKQLQ